MAQGKTRSVAAILVTYNRKKLLIECLNALNRQTYKSLDIYVIDNASSDGTEKEIVSFLDDPHVFYHRMEQNLGGAGGFHYGVRLTAEKGYDYLWLMDDDTIPAENCLEHLLKAADSLDDSFGFLNSYVRFGDGTPCVMNIPRARENSWIYDRNHIPDGLVSIDRATFVSFFVPRNVILDVGLPIKEFFIWADDTEYSGRIAEKYPCYFVGDSIVTHKVECNIGVSEKDFITCDVDRLTRYRYRYRNRFYLMRQKGPKAVWDYFAEFLALTVKLLRAKDHRLRRVGTLWRGFFSGIFFHPSIEFIKETMNTN